jgi:hypothetical protein
MNENRIHALRIIDNSIIAFFIIFLLSLTNSIFINQVGYFGALLLLIARGFIAGENPFNKTGLELAFILYILAEFLAMVFSSQPENCLLYFSRRIFLIPVVYAASSSSFDLKKSKLYLKIYIGASLVSVIIYLGFSVQYIIYDLYSIRGSGPSIFQYPITVSEITSFTVIILFAFLINEKTSLKVKISLFFMFLLSSLALISTYKRTGWLGAAFGIFIILVIKKKWNILIPGIIVVLLLLFFEKNKSEIIIYDYTDHRLWNEQIINTPGRANDVLNIDSTDYYVSDYETGLLTVNNNNIIKLPFPSPVTSLSKWNDSSYIASLIDTRFILLKRNQKALSIKAEFISPGFTTDFKIANGCLYVQDKDSGLSVFKSPDEIITPVRYYESIGLTNVFVDSLYMVFFSPEKRIVVYTLKNNLPDKKIADSLVSYQISAAGLISGRFITSDEKGLRIYSIGPKGLVLKYFNPKINNGYKIFSENRNIFILTINRDLYETSLESDSLNILAINKLDFTPLSASYSKNKFFFTLVKRSRLLSIYDPYLPSNFNRIAFWEAGFKMFKDHPVFGVGDIDLAGFYRHYKHNYDKEIQGHLHNNFIHVLATLGLFGLVAVCFLFFKYLQISFRIYKKRIFTPIVSSFALGVIGSFCAFLVSGLTELNFWDHEIATLIYFIFGLNIAFYKLTEKKN